MIFFLLFAALVSHKKEIKIIINVNGEIIKIIIHLSPHEKTLHDP